MTKSVYIPQAWHNAWVLIWKLYTYTLKNVCHGQKENGQLDTISFAVYISFESFPIVIADRSRGFEANYLVDVVLFSQHV